MKSLTKFVLIAILVFGIGITLNSFASSNENNGLNIAVVNIQKIVQNYNKVKILKDKQKTRLDELKNFVKDARKKIANQKDKTKKKKLEDKYNKELQKKKEVMNKEYKKGLEDINKDISKAIKNIAETNKFDLVLTKNSVLYGGKDVTKEVLKALKNI